jgi:hypothetical protein
MLQNPDRSRRIYALVRFLDAVLDDNGRDRALRASSTASPRCRQVLCDLYDPESPALADGRARRSVHSSCDFYRFVGAACVVDSIREVQGEVDAVQTAGYALPESVAGPSGGCRPKLLPPCSERPVLSRSLTPRSDGVPDD